MPPCGTVASSWTQYDTHTEGEVISKQKYPPTCNVPYAIERRVRDCGALSKDQKGKELIIVERRRLLRFLSHLQKFKLRDSWSTGALLQLWQTVKCGLLRQLQTLARVLWQSQRCDPTRADPSQVDEHPAERRAVPVREKGQLSTFHICLSGVDNLSGNEPFAF